MTDQDDESPESHQRRYHNVTLVAQDVEDDEGTPEESVTMTFTIGSRGTQETGHSYDLEPTKVTNITAEEQQQAVEGLGKETPNNTSASEAHKAVDNGTGSNSIEATAPILTD